MSLYTTEIKGTCDVEPRFTIPANPEKVKINVSFSIKVSRSIIVKEDGQEYPAFIAALVYDKTGEVMETFESMFKELIVKHVSTEWVNICDVLPQWFLSLDEDAQWKTTYEIRTGADSMVLADGERVAFFVNAADAEIFVEACEARDRKARNAHIDKVIANNPDKTELLNMFRVVE